MGGAPIVLHYSTRPDVAPATSLARSSIRHLGEELLQRQAVLDGYGSTFFNMSPGWHSSASQMAASVENRTARTLPVLIRDRFTLVIPTRCDSLLSDTPRSSMISSSSMTMAMSVYPSTLRPDHDTTSCSKCSLKMMHPASVHARTWAHVHDKGAIRVEDQGSARRARPIPTRLRRADRG